MMPLELSFGAALVVGLLGSGHCIGMCGGIVSALGMGIDLQADGRPRSPLPYHLAYNGGRIASYSLVGLTAGGLGAGLTRLGAGPAVGQAIAAAFMVALGLYLTGWWRGLALLEKLGARLWARIRPLGQGLMPVRDKRQAFLLGMLWGWLPCGLVYAVAAWSMSAGSAFGGALLMLGFGLGSLPALLLAGNALGVFRKRARSPLIRGAAGIAIIVFGLYSGFTAIDGDGHPHRHQPTLSSAVFALPTDSTSARIPAILRKLS